MLNINLEDYLNTKDLDKAMELFSLISEENLKVRDTGVNYKTINHWDNNGLIRFGKNSDKGKRKFSFADFLWIKVIDELRTFGTPIPVIKKITDDIYSPLPFKEMMGNLAKNMEMLNDLKAEDKQGFIEFINSGEYLQADFSEIENAFNYLHIFITEAITSKKPIFLIVFKDGEWFPFLKEREHLYPKELIERKDGQSQIRVCITDLIFSSITQDSMLSYAEQMNVFNEKESELISIVKKGAYKKVHVLYKSKRHLTIEIPKSKNALSQLVSIIREKEYREFIVTNKKNKEIRISQLN